MLTTNLTNKQKTKAEFAKALDEFIVKLQEQHNKKIAVLTKLKVGMEK